MKRIQKGLTLLELMATLSIVGILVYFAVPQYQDYIRKGAYSEVALGMEAVQKAVIACYGGVTDLSRCDSAEKLGIQLPGAMGDKAGIEIRALTAAITALPKANRGIEPADSCTLTPTVNNQTLVWSFSGACVSKGWVKS